MFKWAAAEGKLPASVHDTLRLIPGLRRGRTEARETDPVKPVATRRGRRHNQASDADL